MTDKPFDRRHFIKVSTTTVAALVVGCSEKGTIKRWTPTSQAPAPPPSVPQESFTHCGLTSRDITGPYWRKGIPVRSRFDVYDHPGQKLNLSGVVRDRSCRPIPDAVVEMWHANPTVVSANALSPGDSVDYDMATPAFRYYGQFATDQRGAYAMSTMKPGWYLNGTAFRPSHIHVKVYVEGIERLTTQLYFAGDPFIAADPWASRAPERTVQLKSIGKDHLAGRFDFTV